MRRAGAPRELPPPLEMECLKALWRLGEAAGGGGRAAGGRVDGGTAEQADGGAAGEASVKQVQEAMAGERPLAYTTVMTLLERLVKRGRVGRRKQGRAFLYSALATRGELRKLAVEELISVHFGGSRGELRSYLEGVETPVRAVEEPLEMRLDTTLL